MKALPQARALASIHSGTMTGKLNGVMPATTPSGWRTVCTSTPRDTSVECDPLSRCGMPQANSTFSSPRATSPAASLSTLPCSAVISAARSSRWRSTRSRSRNRAAARWLREVAAHSGTAAAALLTACATSSLSARTTDPDCSPVAGLWTGPTRSEPPGIRFPPIQCSIRCMGSFLPRYDPGSNCRQE